MVDKAIKLRYCDIGANLTASDFQGIYRGRQVHRNDLQEVIARARTAGVERIIVTGGSLSESRQAIDLAHQYEGLYATVGCHPTHATDLLRYSTGAEAYIKEMAEVIEKDKRGARKVVALGEFGLDYDRCQFASKEEQKAAFELQLQGLLRFGLPLFLHSRTSDAFADLEKILQKYKVQLANISSGQVGGLGCVHSFTGTREEADMIVKLGFCVGINGCSLKTEDNLKVVASVPIERLMIETDAPYCAITTTSAARPYLEQMPEQLATMLLPSSVKKEKLDAQQGPETMVVKGRNEPSLIGQVAWVVSQLKSVALQDVVEAAWTNTMRVYFPTVGEQTPPTKYSCRSLWGDSATILIPNDWKDVSDLRQVPDNQEVFVSCDGAEDSLVIELLESVTHDDPLDVVTEHFEAVAHDNEASSSRILERQMPDLGSGVWHQEQQTADPIKLRGVLHCQRGGREPQTSVLVDMAVWKLAEVKTDLVLTHSRNLGSRSNNDIADLEDLGLEKVGLCPPETFNAAASSLRLLDWSLFQA